MKKVDNEKKNFLWNAVGLSLNTFNSLFFMIIINRINSGKEAGIFTFAFSLVGMLYFIAIFYSRAFQVSNKKFSNKEYIIHRIINCILTLIISTLFVVICKYSFYKSMIILLITLFRVLEALADVFYGIEQVNGYLYKAGKSMFFKGIISIIVFLIIDIITKDVRLSCFGIIIINLFGILFYDIKNSKDYIENDIKMSNLISLYKKTLPIFIFSFLNIYLVNSTKYTLDFYDSAEIQNIFGIILMPGTMLSLCCQYILNPYLNKMSDFKKNNNFLDFNKLIAKISSYVILLGILGEIVCYLIGIPLLNFVYNIDLKQYKYLLLIIIIGAICYALVNIFSSALTILERNFIQMIIYIINSIFAFIISIILISNYKIKGAAIGYSIIMLLILITYILCYNKTMKDLRYGNETTNK